MEQCLINFRDKLTTKIGSPNIGALAVIGPKIRRFITFSSLELNFFFFLNVPSLVFDDIAQDCSLEQCLTASRAETSKNKFGEGGKIGANISSPILLRIHSNLLVLLA